MNDLMQAVEQILGDGHLNTESLAHLRAAYETAHDEETYIVELERQNRGMREAARMALGALERPNQGLLPVNGEWRSMPSLAIDALRAALEEDK